jgi:hypothetical protein
MPRAARNSNPWESANPFRVERVGEALVLRRSLRGVALAGCRICWLSIWTCGCAMLAREVWLKPGLQTVLFAVPFFVAWFAVASILVHLLTGEEEVRLGPDGLAYLWRAIIPLRRRVVPLDQIKGIVAEPDEPSSPADEDAASAGVRAVTLGAPIRFGLGLKLAHREEAAALLRETLAALAADPLSANPLDAKALAALADAPPLPEGSLIRIERDWGRLIVDRRFPFNPLTFAALTFFTFFWDGIVGVFLVQFATHPKSISWPALIIVPHTVIGLFLLVGWFGTLLTPFRRSTWTFEPGAIAERRTLFGLGRARTIAGAEPARVEFRKGGPRNRPRPRTGFETSDDAPFWVALVARDGSELLTVTRLTEGEARRLAAELESTFHDSLKQPHGSTLAMPAGRGDADPLFDRWLDDRPR